MTVSEFYNDRNVIESFGRSKVFETCRKMRDQWKGFPTYSETANEFVISWLIYVMAKTGNTTTSQAVSRAILSGNNLRCGDELFIHWFANVLTNPDFIESKISSIWIFHDDPGFVQVNLKTNIQIFQEFEKTRVVSSATYLSGAFLYDFATTLKKTLKDESLESEKIFEYEDE